MTHLHDRVLGCLAATRVASAMGAPVETLTRKEIQSKYGFVDQFLPYEHYAERWIQWTRPPGTTEDGIERQNLLCRAIIDRGDRITAADLGRSILAYSDPAKMRYTCMPEDMRTLELLGAGVPAVDAGRLCDRIARNGLARAGQPIGLINAGDPDGAVRDCRDIGRVWFSPRDLGITWAAVYVVAISEAVRPGATVESTIDVALGYAPEMVRMEIQRAVQLAGRAIDQEALYSEFSRIYNGDMVWTYVLAPETVSKAFAVFAFSQGDVKEAILTAVDFGRDTDCIGAMAGGLAGALTGTGSLPVEWIHQVDDATASNPYTNTNWTIQQHADRLYGALQNRARRLRERLTVLEA